jgi:ferrous iron transport protein B
MTESIVHLVPGGRLVALVGNPNCGKTALFNLLTGSRQKVANYAGVTVERKEGRLATADGRVLRVLDLPGTYGLYPRAPDERVTRDVLSGTAAGERRPDLVVCVLDATRLRRGLRLVLAVRRTGVPCVVALNMADLAERRGLRVDADAMSRALGVPVVATVGVRGGGDSALRAVLADPRCWPQATAQDAAASGDGHDDVRHDVDRVDAILRELGLERLAPHEPTERIDRVVLHPVVGPLLLVAVLFAMFQAVFAWAETPMGWIEAATAALGKAAGAWLPDGWVRSLVVDGLVAGVGGVLVFLPQIVILFFFILLLEDVGYLPRGAFLLDRMMGTVGLSGRSFIPLLSSFACAIPGIMAARTIADPRDRIATILIAPLMTCSARLPVYALLIGAFVPRREVWGGLELQGLVLLGLYAAGVAGAYAVAWTIRRMSGSGHVRTLMMELPDYHVPSWRNVAIGLLERVRIFVRRVGGVILVLTVLLWFLASVPGPPECATGAPIGYSLAGMLGKALAVVFEPIGFNWQISIALVPGLAAREVAVSALGTVYAMSATGDDTAEALAPVIAEQWPLATALSLLVWYVFAPMCLSTLATIRRETGGWRYAVIAGAYLFVLAYLASFITYRAALWMVG